MITIPLRRIGNGFRGESGQIDFDFCLNGVAEFIKIDKPIKLQISPNYFPGSRKYSYNEVNGEVSLRLKNKNKRIQTFLVNIPEQLRKGYFKFSLDK